VHQVRVLRAQSAMAQCASLDKAGRAASAAAGGSHVTSLDNPARRLRREDGDFQVKVLEDTQQCLNLSEKTVSLQYSVA